MEMTHIVYYWCATFASDARVALHCDTTHRVAPSGARYYGAASACVLSVCPFAKLILVIKGYKQDTFVPRAQTSFCQKYHVRLYIQTILANK